MKIEEPVLLSLESEDLTQECNDSDEICLDLDLDLDLDVKKDASIDDNDVFSDISLLCALVQFDLILGKGMTFVRNRDFMLERARPKVDPFDDVAWLVREVRDRNAELSCRALR